MKVKSGKVLWLVLLAVVALGVAVAAIILYPGRQARVLVEEAEAAALSNPDAAVTLAREALQFRNEHPEALRLLARLTEPTNPEEAYGYLQVLQQSNAAEFDDLLNLVRIGQLTDRAEEVRPVLAQLLEDAPANPDVIALDAIQTFFESRNASLALSRAEAALEIDPTQPAALFLKGSLALNRRGAVDFIVAKQALLNASNDSGVYGGRSLALLLAAYQHLRLAREELEQVTARLIEHPRGDSDDQRAAYRLQMLLYPERADSIVDEVIGRYGDTEPVPVAAWLNQANRPERVLDLVPSEAAVGQEALFRERLRALRILDRYDEAQEMVETAGPELTELNRAMQVTEISTDKGDLESADLAWEEAFELALREKSGTALSMLARNAMQRTDWADALRTYDMLFSDERFAQMAGVVYWQEYLLSAVKERNTEKAWEITDRMQTLQAEYYPNDNDHAYLNLLLDRDLAESLEVTRRLVEDHPEQESFYTTLALGYVKNGRVAEALQLLEGLERDWNEATDSGRAIYAHVLQAAGQATRARNMARLVRESEVLPEEWAWIEAILGNATE